MLETQWPWIPMAGEIGPNSCLAARLLGLARMCISALPADARGTESVKFRPVNAIACLASPPTENNRSKNLDNANPIEHCSHWDLPAGGHGAFC